MKVITQDVMLVKTAEEIFEAAMDCAKLMREHRDEALECLKVKDAALAQVLEDRWEGEQAKMVEALDQKMDRLCGGKQK